MPKQHSKTRRSTCFITFTSHRRVRIVLEFHACFASRQLKENFAITFYLQTEFADQFAHGKANRRRIPRKISHVLKKGKPRHLFHGCSLDALGPCTPWIVEGNEGWGTGGGG